MDVFRKVAFVPKKRCRYFLFLGRKKGGKMGASPPSAPTALERARFKTKSRATLGLLGPCIWKREQGGALMTHRIGGTVGVQIKREGRRSC